MSDILEYNYKKIDLLEYNIKISLINKNVEKEFLN